MSPVRGPLGRRPRRVRRRTKVPQEGKRKNHNRVKPWLVNTGVGCAVDYTSFLTTGLMLGGSGDADWEARRGVIARAGETTKTTSFGLSQRCVSNPADRNWGSRGLHGLVIFWCGGSYPEGRSRGPGSNTAAHTSTNMFRARGNRPCDLWADRATRRWPGRSNCNGQKLQPVLTPLLSKPRGGAVERWVCGGGGGTSRT